MDKNIKVEPNKRIDISFFIKETPYSVNPIEMYNFLEKAREEGLTEDIDLGNHILMVKEKDLEFALQFKDYYNDVINKFDLEDELYKVFNVINYYA